ncbi:MAG TPA: amino acid ABC transporter substrate-binding protein [Streptosporangiaceae bacterium]|nr:amino acid ABC transporter substrate-binding protein [Streptosporangiaceae bacterium]
MRSHRARFLSVGITMAATATMLAACSSGSSGGSSNSSSTKSPILIGASISTSGDFSADGQAFLRGYQLWVHDVNASGGLLGRQVKLDWLPDNSTPNQVNANYTKLISVDHVDLTFGPFSSALTGPAETVIARNGYAFIEGAGGSPAVFSSPGNIADHNLFDVSLPIEDTLAPIAKYLAALPAGQRPKTAAYPMADDIFGYPPVQVAQGIMSKAGIKTVYSHIFPEEPADYAPAADNVAATHADVVVLGSTDVPTVAAFMKAFEQQHYVPKYFAAAAGPDQGTDFTSAVGVGNANGMMVPNGWYPSSSNPASQKMVAEYVAKYGGDASGVNADIAEAYSVGQVAAQAIVATKGTDNAKVIQYLHSGVTLSSVQGPVTFDSLGRNGDLTAYMFQWQNGQFVQVLPVGAPGTVKLLAPKPAWTNG